MLRFIQTMYRCCSVEGTVSLSALPMIRLCIPVQIPKPSLPINIGQVLSTNLRRLKIIAMKVVTIKVFFGPPIKFYVFVPRLYPKAIP